MTGGEIVLLFVFGVIVYFFLSTFVFNIDY